MLALNQCCLAIFSRLSFCAIFCKLSVTEGGRSAHAGVNNTTATSHVGGGGGGEGEGSFEGDARKNFELPAL